MTEKHKRIVGDTLLPYNGIAYLRPGDPYDWTGLTGKWELEEDDGTVVQAATATGFTAHPTQAFTASASTSLLTCNGHGVQKGDQVIVASTGTLPSGLAASTRYFAVNVTPNAFQLATVPEGTAVTIASAGSGTHTFYVVGSYQVTLTDAAVASAGQFRFWATAVDGSSDIATFPNDDDGAPIEIKAKGN